MRQAGNTILRVYARSPNGLFLMPKPLIHFFSQSVSARKYQVGLAAGFSGNSLNIGSLVETSILKAGAESVLPTIPPDTSVLQFGSDHTNDRRRIQTSAQAGPYGHVRSQVQRYYVLKAAIKFRNHRS